MDVSRLTIRFEMLGAALVGVVAFFLVARGSIIVPNNIAWLDKGDPATAYLGWAFFRNSAWTMPPGLNPSYGLELPNSIYYSDSIPLLALLVKGIPFLPSPFQYFGLWLLLCFVLQALLAWKLGEAVGLPPAARLLTAGLFVFVPPFLWRLRGHYALVGHWLILAGLYLYLRPGLFAKLKWAGLLAAAAMVHGYLLAMVAALWVAALLQRLLVRSVDPKNAAIEVVLMLAVVAGSLWLCGFWVLQGNFSARGYGFYRMNLLSPIDPSGWSYVLRDIPEEWGDYEGFNYLGLGVWSLCLFASPMLAHWPWNIDWRRWLPLGAVLCALTMFAITNRVGVGLTNIAVIPLPAPIASAAGLLRASGRMFWPAVYALILGLIPVVLKRYGPRRGTLFVLAALLVQVVDTRAGWGELSSNVAARGAVWTTSLRSPFWSIASGRYREVRVIPVGSHTEHWKELAYYAATHGMATDAVYLARVDPKGFATAQQEAKTTIDTGRFRNDAIYILDEQSAHAVESHAGPKDLLARIDGLLVFAKDGAQIAQEARITNLLK